MDETRALADWDSPEAMLRGVIAAMDLPKEPRAAISDTAEAQTLFNPQSLIPDVR